MSELSNSYNKETFEGFDKLPIETLLTFATSFDGSTANPSDSRRELMAYSLARMLLQQVRYSELVVWLEKTNNFDYSPYPKNWILKSVGIFDKDYWEDN
jgi:hypothetical protein